MKDSIVTKLSNYTLLFIENEKGIRENFTEYFSLILKEVYTAKDGIEGFEQYKKYKPNLIITDIKMPNLNGIDLVKKIRKIDQITPIIVISAHTDVEFLLKSIPLGLIDYVVKPLNESKLEEMFCKFLEQEEKSFIYDTNNGIISFNEKTYHLSQKENILVAKLLFEKRIISYEEIGVDIWDEKEMTPNALRVFIKNLRKKLPEGFIQNVTNQGYKLGI